MLWVARRAATKQTWPGKLDHIVAGGQVGQAGVRVVRRDGCMPLSFSSLDVDRTTRLGHPRPHLYNTHTHTHTHTQPFGLCPAANVAKECWEEAGIPAHLAAAARPVGFVSYASLSEEGLKPDVLLCYDLELPADFVPQPQDGEVSVRSGRGALCVCGGARHCP
jgi:hypothetical protein